MAVKSVWIADRIIYMRNLMRVLFVMGLIFVLIVKYVWIVINIWQCVILVRRLILLAVIMIVPGELMGFALFA